jgi:hypothetical protein
MNRLKTSASATALQAVAQPAQAPAAPSIPDVNIATDKLRGAAEIGEFIGEPEARVRWLVRHRQIPFGKEGGLLIASKRALIAHYLAATAGTQAA